MSDNVHDIAVVSPTSLSNNQDGKSLPLSERDVALRSAIPTELQSFGNSEVQVFLLAMLEGMSRQMLSSDSHWLARSHARHICESLGIGEERFDSLLKAVKPGIEHARTSNPLHSRF